MIRASTYLTALVTSLSRKWRSIVPICSPCMAAAALHDSDRRARYSGKVCTCAVGEEKGKVEPEGCCNKLHNTLAVDEEKSQRKWLRLVDPSPPVPTTV